MGPTLRWVLQDSGAFPDLPGLDQLPAEQVVELGGGVDAAAPACFEPAPPMRRGCLVAG